MPSATPKQIAVSLAGLGAVLICAGVALVNTPAAIIVTGIMFFCLGMLVVEV